jgi:hypothetical protein
MGAMVLQSLISLLLNDDVIKMLVEIRLVYCSSWKAQGRYRITLLNTEYTY